jgi:hypothetical protein
MNVKLTLPGTTIGPVGVAEVADVEVGVAFAEVELGAIVVAVLVVEVELEGTALYI